MYRFETELVEDFEKILTKNKNPFKVTDLGFEFDYRSGRTDVIGVTRKGDLFAFEAKLTNWRIALHQAYRNSSFADYCYVVLPETTAENALKRRDEFDKRGIGLCSIKKNEMNVMIRALKMKTFQPWMSNLARSYIVQK